MPQVRHAATRRHPQGDVPFLAPPVGGESMARKLLRVIDVAEIFHAAADTVSDTREFTRNAIGLGLRNDSETDDEVDAEEEVDTIE